MENKYQEAYEVIGSIIPKGLVIGKIEDLPKHFESFKEVVDRATPTEIIIDCNYHGGTDYSCPYCGNSIMKVFKPDFCQCCGQALEWKSE